jgi:ketosteroid isomerase-like protein
MDQPDRDPTQEAEELRAVARQWAHAIVANDAARMAGFVADDWVMVDASGISPGERFLGLVASGELTHSAMDPAGPLRVRVYGDTAVVTGRVTNTAHHGGRRFDADEWTTDVFVRRDGRWSCVLTHVTDAAP